MDELMRFRLWLADGLTQEGDALLRQAVLVTSGRADSVATAGLAHRLRLTADAMSAFALELADEIEREERDDGFDS